MFDSIRLFAAFGGLMTIMALPFLVLGGVIWYCKTLYQKSQATE